MKQQILNLKKKLLIVELPEGCLLPNVIKGSILYYYVEVKQDVDYCSLPEGNYKEIGKLTDIKESQFAEWVEAYTSLENRFRNYTTPAYIEFLMKTAKESFFSKLQADEIYFENPLGKKPHLGMFIEQKGNCVKDYDKAFNEWREAQQKVWDINRCWIFEIL
jgi:hypothetical protein